MTRKFEPDGEAISLPPERIAKASAEGTGDGETQRQGVEALGAWFAAAGHAQ